jgi:hypothetical protein
MRSVTDPNEELEMKIAMHFVMDIAPHLDEVRHVHSAGSMFVTLAEYERNLHSAYAHGYVAGRSDEREEKEG